MVGYVGEGETSLSSLVLEPEHSLVAQAYAPKEMLSGTVNVDGFGVGWYVQDGLEHGGEPAVYRSSSAIWSDRSFAGIASKLRSRSVFAAVRDATPETIFAGLMDRLRALENPGTGELAGATEETVRHVCEVCAGLGVNATLNLGLTDGEALVFTRYSLAGTGGSLYYLEDGGAFPGAAVVASERLDGDPGWRAVPDRHLLTADRASGVELRPL